MKRKDKLQISLVICFLGRKIINKNVITDKTNYHSEINHSHGDDSNVYQSPNREKCLQRVQKSTLSPFDIGLSR